jgi:hypothetical protein
VAKLPTKDDLAATEIRLDRSGFSARFANCGHIMSHTTILRSLSRTGLDPLCDGRRIRLSACLSLLGRSLLAPKFAAFGARRPIFLARDWALLGAAGCGDSGILGGGDLLNKIDDGSLKLWVWNLHEGFRQLEPVRRGEIVRYVLQGRRIMVVHSRVRCSLEEKCDRHLQYL